jgi:cell wall-associated NlpC family hydrolase
VWTRSDSGLRSALPALTLALLLGACATPSAPPGKAVSGDSPTAPHTARDQVVAAALAQVGSPYRFGGETPRGFDCSGLVRFAHGAADIPVPRQTHVQARHARPVNRAQLTPGDLLFFRIDEPGKVSHVSIYVGDNRFVHAPSSGGHVHVERLDHPYWASRLLHTGHYFEH